MGCFFFKYERSSTAESSSCTNSYRLNSLSVSSEAADSLSISTAELSISTAESCTGIVSTAAVYEKVAEQNSGDGPSKKTPKPPPPGLIWTVQMHKKFVDAVAHLGIENAVPKTILQLLRVDGLTVEDVASHLATYQVSLKRMQGLSNGSCSGGAGGGNGGGAHSYSLSS